jgi:type IV secretory pathway VirD2 relaxase
MVRCLGRAIEAGRSGKEGDCKIKRTLVRPSLRSQVFVCTLVFSPWTGTFPAPYKVHRVPSFLNFSLLSMPKAMAASRYAGADRAACTPQQAFSRCPTIAPQRLLRRVNRVPMIPAWQAMTTTIFRVHPGRSRSRGTRTDVRTQPFLKQVQSAVRKAGGNPNRIGGFAGKGKGSGRFNARGRGAKVVASFPKDGGGWGRDSAGRFRSRRVVVKARVVKLNPQRGARGPKIRGKVSNAVGAHLRYLEREGVTRDGEKGRAYNSFENEADGMKFIERGREDRHQFRFIVAPEDATEMDDLRGFTRDLMRQMEKDLDTRLDWIAVDHHNTGHPHTHINVRGVNDDGKILNIAGDYIAHGVRHRASELVTLELGHQSEIEVSRKLASEVDAERLTRLDKMLIAEQRDQGVIDLRPGEGSSYLVRENRHLMISRAKRLERYGLAAETEPGRWFISGSTEVTLNELGERGDIIKTMHRALTDHGLADERGTSQYVPHGSQTAEPVIGRVIGKGLAGDEMGERVYLVVDGVDGRVHHLEFADPARIEDVRRGMIVEVGPMAARPRAADLNIADMRDEAGIYRPSAHLARARGQMERIGGTPRLSSAPMSAAWRRCAAPAMWNGSTPTNGVSPLTSASGGCATTSAGAAMDLPSAPFQRSIFKPRSVATGRHGSTGSWSRTAAYRLLTPGSAATWQTPWNIASRRWWTWAMPTACRMEESGRPPICSRGWSVPR